MPHFTTSSTRWAAIQSRNPKAANAFVYCVITTKIYCRPTCPSRLARRANIVFQDTAAEAAAKGFRACKRCRPELSDGEGDPQKIAVGKACDLIRNEQPGGEDARWSVKALATEVGLTESHFCRIFKKVMGMTVGGYRAIICTGNTRELSDVHHTHEADAAQDSVKPFPTLNLPSDFDPENWLSLTDFNESELEQDWNRFFGLPLSRTMLTTPQVQFNFADSDQSFPDPFSRSTNPGVTEDGFRFLDFDNVH